MDDAELSRLEALWTEYHGVAFARRKDHIAHLLAEAAPALLAELRRLQAELSMFRQEMAHRVGIEDKIRHLIDPKGERICGTDTMVEELLLDLKKWRDAAIDASAKAGNLASERRDWKEIAEERLFTAERLRALCREAAMRLDEDISVCVSVDHTEQACGECGWRRELAERLRKAGGET